MPKVSEFPFQAPTGASKIPTAGETHFTPTALFTDTVMTGSTAVQQMDSVAGYSVNGITVVRTQGTHISWASGSVTVSSFNSVVDALRTHGLIAYDGPVLTLDLGTHTFTWTYPEPNPFDWRLYYYTLFNPARIWYGVSGTITGGARTLVVPGLIAGRIYVLYGTDGVGNFWTKESNPQFHIHF